jgi:hypothetical protein
MAEMTALLTPFLVSTTAIMTAVIILILIGAWLVSVQKRINRETVEKHLNTIKVSVISLILLEVFLTLIEN